MLQHLRQKQKLLQEMKNDFYTSRGTHVYFQEPLANDEIDMEGIVATLENQIPHHLLSEVDIIVIGWFEEFKNRDIEAFYKDGILHISHLQKNEKDLIDNIVHETAHSLESVYGFEIYGDQEIRGEFLRKRKILHDKLWALGYKGPQQWFMNTEHDQEFEDFLFETVGKDKLRMICMGLFINAYAPVSLREYFATGFADYYLYQDHGLLAKVSPALAKKMNFLQVVKNLDNGP